VDWIGYVLSFGLVALLWIAAVTSGHDSRDAPSWRSYAPDVTEQLR